MNCLTIAHTVVHKDALGRYCLNDLHRAAGGNRKHAPNRWARTDTYSELVKELTPEMELAPAVVRRGGATPGTYVCEELVFAYAMWISASFHLRVIRAYRALFGQEKLATADLYAQRIAFEGLKAKSEKKGTIGGRLLAERKWEKPALTKEEEVWKLRMEPELFAHAERLPA